MTPTKQIDPVVEARDSRFRPKHAKAIADEIGSLRKWLEYLEQDIHSGVIPALLMMSISESCAKLIYAAGMINGAELSEDYEYHQCAAFALACVEDEISSLTLEQGEQEKR